MGPLAAIGAGIAGTFTTLATLSPQAAPYLEMMKTQFFMLSNVVGEVFEPVIRKAYETFEGFVSWLNSEEGKGVLETVQGIIMGIWTDAETLATKLREIPANLGIDIEFTAGGNIVEKYGLEALATLFGWSIAGPSGALAAGGTTAILTAEGGISGAWERILGSTALGGGLGAGIGALFGGVGALPGGAVGAAAGFTISGVQELINYLTNPAYGGLATANSGQPQVDINVNINYPENESEAESWSQMKNAHTGGT